MGTSEAIATLQSLHTHSAVGELLGVSPRRLRFLLYRKPEPYTEFSIPKKTGGDRRILVPPAHIRAWQRQLAVLLLSAYRRREGVYGFCKGVGVRENAGRHVARKAVVGLDLENFFESITHARVMGVFCRHPFDLPPRVSAVLAQLCTWHGILPQGAPTSPILTNWICRTLDRQLFRFARAHGCTFTRYADDITLSVGVGGALESIATIGAGGPVLSRRLVQIIERNGFHINGSKTRVARRSQQQRVTGLTVNAKVNLPRSYLRAIRALLHRWAKDGYSATTSWFLEHHGDKRDSVDLNRFLLGKLAFAAHVRGEADTVVLRYRLSHAELVSAEGDEACGAESVVSLRPLEASIAWKRLVEYAVFLVRAFGSDGTEIAAGTAFAVGPRQFVTAWHVCENSYEPGTVAPRIEVSPAVDVTSNSFEVSVAESDAHTDLAVLVSNASPIACLSLSGVPVEDGASVLAAGFAGFVTAGDGLWFEDARVSQLARRQGVLIGRVSTPVVTGASGGPVIDHSTGQVVGVLVGNSEHPRAAHGFIGIEHVVDLLRRLES